IQRTELLEPPVHSKLHFVLALYPTDGVVGAETIVDRVAVNVVSQRLVRGGLEKAKCREHRTTGASNPELRIPIGTAAVANASADIGAVRSVRSDREVIQDRRRDHVVVSKAKVVCDENLVSSVQGRVAVEGSRGDAVVLAR